MSEPQEWFKYFLLSGEEIIETPWIKIDRKVGERLWNKKVIHKETRTFTV